MSAMPRIVVVFMVMSFRVKRHSLYLAREAVAAQLDRTLRKNSHTRHYCSVSRPSQPTGQGQDLATLATSLAIQSAVTSSSRQPVAWPRARP